METFWKSVGEQWKSLGLNWAAYSAIGSFFLYVLGYLVTRFELTMLGVGTNLDVLEERYFFAGARFVVYLLATIPSLVLLLIVPAVIAWLIWKNLPLRFRTAAASIRSATWYLLGIVFSVSVIQFIARQSFVLNNLLLAKSLPGPKWLQMVLLDDQEKLAPLFFATLVAATLVTAMFLYLGSHQSHEKGEKRGFTLLLAVLLVVQALLLPINYATLIAHKSFPRVVGISAEGGQSAWLIWENNDTQTFLVAAADDPRNGRELVTSNRKESKDPLRIVAYEPVLRLIFPEP